MIQNFVPIFVAISICEDDVRGDFFHDCFGGFVHQVEGIEVVGFGESVGSGEAVCQFLLIVGIDGYPWKPLPSRRTMIQVFGRRESSFSKFLTYS
jgi:hypothetical protein